MYKNKMNEINQVSDTAHWVATYRAIESKKEKPLFIDPFAEKLAGDLGYKLFNQIPIAKWLSPFFIMRTKVIDDLLLDLLETKKIDVVINIGSGLDTRPYRLNLPPSLLWIEVDSSNILKFKSHILKDFQPFCEHIELNSNKTLFIEFKKILNSKYTLEPNVLFIAEGLLPYLSREESALLVQDIATITNSDIYFIFDDAKPFVFNFLGKLWNPLLKTSKKQFNNNSFNSIELSKYSLMPYKKISLLEEMIRYKRVPWILKFLFFTTRFWIKPIKTWFFSQSTVNIWKKHKFLNI